MSEIDGDHSMTIELELAELTVGYNHYQPDIDGAGATVEGWVELMEVRVNGGGDCLSLADRYMSDEIKAVVLQRHKQQLREVGSYAITIT